MYPSSGPAIGGGSIAQLHRGVPIRACFFRLWDMGPWLCASFGHHEDRRGLHISFAQGVQRIAHHNTDPEKFMVEAGL
jgi:hypothetical protein